MIEVEIKDPHLCEQIEKHAEMQRMTPQELVIKTLKNCNGLDLFNNLRSVEPWDPQDSVKL